MIAGQFLFMSNRTDYLWHCDGACEGFYPATPERIGAPLLDDAQSDAVGSKTSRAYKRISNEAVHIPRERDKKISPTRNSAGVRNTVTLTHENDRVSKRIPATHLVVCFTIWLIATEVLVFEQIKFDTRTHLLEQAARGFHGPEVVVPNERPSHVPSGANMQTL
jgi:hypothetical protein